MVHNDGDQIDTSENAGTLLDTKSESIRKVVRLFKTA